MSNISFVDKRVIENFLAMRGGYVLDFSNRELQDFIIDTVQLDIYNNKYSNKGESKANRVRELIRIEENITILKLLKDFLNYVRSSDYKSNIEETDEYLKTENEFICIIQKLENTGENIIQVENFEKITKDFAKRQLEKINKRQFEGDYEGVITSCRALLENVIQTLYFDITKQILISEGKLLKDWKSLAKEMKLDPESEPSEQLKEILRGFISIINGFSTIRNSSSDSHSQQYNPSKHHSKLAVNCVLTIIDFLYDTIEYQQVK